MKIEKLYTLSQFVDYVQTTRMGLRNLYFSIRNYNEFLKQPLKKEMFVNEIEKPLSKNYKSIDLMLFDEDLEAWQNAEKKVIFEMKFNYIPEDDIFYYEDKVVSSLGELAELSNNELVLKNVEL